MTFRKIYGAAVLCTAALFYSACGSGGMDRTGMLPVTRANIAGAWSRDVRGGVQTFTITFLPTGRYSVLNSEQQGTIYGDWSLAGDTLTIQDTDCKDYIGTYRLVLTGNSLAFELINDDSNRPEVIPGTWIRASLTAKNVK